MAQAGAQKARQREQVLNGAVNTTRPKALANSTTFAKTLDLQINGIAQLKASSAPKPGSPSGEAPPNIFQQPAVGDASSVLSQGPLSAKATPPVFDAKKAFEGLQGATFYTAGTLLDTATGDQTTATETAGATQDALAALSDASGSFGESGGGFLSAAGKIPPALALLAAPDPTGMTKVGAIATLAAAAAEAMQAGGLAGQGGQEAAAATQEGIAADAQYKTLTGSINNTAAQQAALENAQRLVAGLTNPLAGTQQQVGDVERAAAQIDPNIVAPQAQGQAQGQAQVTGAGAGQIGDPATPTPTQTASDWTTPAPSGTATTPDQTVALDTPSENQDPSSNLGANTGANTGLASNLAQNPLTPAGSNQKGGGPLTAEEEALIAQYDAVVPTVEKENNNAGTIIGNASASLQNTAGAAAAFAGLKASHQVAGPSQEVGQLVARLKEKKRLAQQSQEPQPQLGLGTAFTGNGVNPQDPNAPQGQVATAQGQQAPEGGQAQQGQNLVAQAPQGDWSAPATPSTPATPANTAAAPPRTLTIPKLAQAPAAQAPQPAVA
ncbi:MAG: hypothetical protein ACK551_05465 [Vampirovibrionales bacterium]